MGKIKISVVALAAMATLALAAQPALAHQFTSSRMEITKGKGYEEIEIPEKPEQPEFEPERMQEFKLGKFRILCYKAQGKGPVFYDASFRMSAKIDGRVHESEPVVLKVRLVEVKK